MGDALGTYFEARKCYKTSSLSLENGGITLSSLALCKLCYETLFKCGKEAKISCDNHLVTLELEDDILLVDAINKEYLKESVR